MGEEKESWCKETDVNGSSIKKTNRNAMFFFPPIFFFCLSVIST